MRDGKDDDDDYYPYYYYYYYEDYDNGDHARTPEPTPWQGTTAIAGWTPWNTGILQRKDQDRGH